MSENNINHFSLTNEWIDSKSKFSKWEIFKRDNGDKHLSKRFKNLLIIHWFSYIDSVNISNILDSTHNSEEKFFIHLSFLKILGKPFITNIFKKTEIVRGISNLKTFLIPVKSSCKSKAENFLINLRSWNENCLSKNWKRNLRRSKRSHDNFSYKEVNLYKEIENIYDVIQKNAKLKKYNYPYSLKFLKKLIKKSNDKIFGIGAYDLNNKLVAIRAFYIVNDTAIDFIAAALPESLKDYLTYNIAYELIKKAQNMKLKTYNMGGVDQKLNPGVYNFKKGLGGNLISDGQIFLALSTKLWIPSFTIKIILKILSSFI